MTLVVLNKTVGKLLRTLAGRGVMVGLLAFLSVACSSFTAEHCRGEASAPNIQSTASSDPEIQRVLPALVRLDVVMRVPRAGRFERRQAAGSGVIISPDGYIVTNHHVAADAHQITCRLFDGQEVNAKLIAADALSDIAVVKIDRSLLRDATKPSPTADFGDSDQLKVGDTVFALGSPMAVSQSVTKGIVSNRQMILPKLLWPATLKLDGEDVGSLVRWIAHDAVIYGGNSGGPLVDAHGRIVGINEVGLGSLGGAIPSNLAREVAEQLVKYGEVPRSWTGMELQPRLKGDDRRGVLVAGVVKGSPADKAKVEPGDLLVEFDGVETDCRMREDLSLCNQQIFATPIGKTVELVLMRGPARKLVQLTTVKRGRAQADPVEFKSWGMIASDLTMLSALERKRPNATGVLVRSLAQAGPAASAKPKIEVGDVIVRACDQEIRNVEELRTAVSQVQKEDPKAKIVVEFERKGRRLLTVVQPKKDNEQDEPPIAQKPWLGADIQEVDEDLGTLMGLPQKSGVRVLKVFKTAENPSSPLKAGDVIVRLDGKEVSASRPTDLEAFRNRLRRFAIGSEVPLEVMRNGERVLLNVKLAPPPKLSSQQKKYQDETFEFTARELSFSDRVDKQLEAELQGVLIEHVESGGWARLAQLAIGDVLISADGMATPNVDALGRVMKKAKEEKREQIVLFVQRGVHTLYLELRPVWETDRK